MWSFAFVHLFVCLHRVRAQNFYFGLLEGKE